MSKRADRSVVLRLDLRTWSEEWGSRAIERSVVLRRKVGVGPFVRGGECFFCGLLRLAHGNLLPSGKAEAAKDAKVSREGPRGGPVARERGGNGGDH